MELTLGQWSMIGLLGLYTLWAVPKVLTGAAVVRVRRTYHHESCYDFMESERRAEWIARIGLTVPLLVLGVVMGQAFANVSAIYDTSMARIMEAVTYLP